MKKIIYLILIFNFTNACNDLEDMPEVILEPLHKSFLPLFPNSYWCYENEFGMQDTFFTKDYDIKTTYCYGPPDQQNLDSFKTTTLYRSPTLSNLSYIYGYDTYSCSENPLIYNQFGIVLSENVGDSWDVDRKDPRYYQTVQAKKTVSKSDNYLEVIEFERALQFGAIPNDTIIFKETYQRDVGLIERLRINTYEVDTIKELVLKNYEINR